MDLTVNDFGLKDDTFTMTDQEIHDGLMSLGCIEDQVETFFDTLIDTDSNEKQLETEMHYFTNESVESKASLASAA
jgi:hypothetical protein